MRLAEEPKPFSAHIGTISGIAFSPDGVSVVPGANGSHELDRDAIVWDVSSGNIRMRLRGNQVGLCSVAYSPHGTLIATGGGGAMVGNFWTYDSAIRFWDEDGKECGKIVDDLFVVSGLAFSSDGSYLLTGSKKFRSSALCAAFSADGRYIAVGSGWCDSYGAPCQDCVVTLYEADTGLTAARCSHRYPVTALAFSPKGDCIVAGGERGELHRWTVGSDSNTRPAPADSSSP